MSFDNAEADSALLHMFNSIPRAQNNPWHWLTSDKGAHTTEGDPQAIRERENEKQFC